MALLDILSLSPSDTCRAYEAEMIFYGLLYSSLFAMVATFVVATVWGDTICAPLPPYPTMVDITIVQPHRPAIKAVSGSKSAPGELLRWDSDQSADASSPRIRACANRSLAGAAAPHGFSSSFARRNALFEHDALPWNDEFEVLPERVQERKSTGARVWWKDDASDYDSGDTDSLFSEKESVWTITVDRSCGGAPPICESCNGCNDSGCNICNASGCTGSLDENNDDPTDDEEHHFNFGPEYEFLAPVPMVVVSMLDRGVSTGTDKRTEDTCKDTDKVSFGGEVDEVLEAIIEELEDNEEVDDVIKGVEDDCEVDEKIDAIVRHIFVFDSDSMDES